jgi:hypothetical protein
MKRAFQSLTLLCVMVASVVFFAPSQADAGNWTWKKYKMRFWLPAGMKATKNTSYTFIAKGSGIIMKIQAWKSRYGTSVSACQKGYRSYHIIRSKRILVRKRLSGKYDTTGSKTWRYLYMGDGYYRGSRVYWSVIGMANHRIRTQFYVRMWWKKWRHRWVKPRVRMIARRIRIDASMGRAPVDTPPPAGDGEGDGAPPPSTGTGWWTWKRHRMKFWLPRGMRVTKNNSYTFIAKGSGIILKISAWRSSRGTSVSACQKGYRSYYIIRNKRILVRKRLRGKYTYNGSKMWRYLYMGTGYYRGSRVYWSVIGGANHRLRSRFYIRMWWKKHRHYWVKPRVRKIARRIRNY